MERFFELYIAAFLSLDPSNVSKFYSYPVTFFSETGQIVVFEESDFLENTKKLFEIYNELGVNEIEFEIQEQKSTNKLFAMVSVQWSFIGADGVEIYSAITRYLIQTETLKIASVITVDEMSKINALLDK